MTTSQWWHGGSTVRGNMILPPKETGVCRSGDTDYSDVVFITPTRDLALTYACSTADPWLYEVEPIGAVIQDPGSVLPPGHSMMCLAARVARRYKPSRVEVELRGGVRDLMATVLTRRYTR